MVMTITKDSLDVEPPIKETKYQEEPQGKVEKGLTGIKRDLTPKPKSAKINSGPK